MNGDIDGVPKPPELLDLYDLTAKIFEALKRAFKIGDTHQFSLTHIDAAAESLHDVKNKAAFTMRKLQALRHVAAPGVITANHVVVFFIADLNEMLTNLARRSRMPIPRPTRC